MNDVAAVVVAYGNPEATRKCVESLQQQSMPVDILVWDNDNGALLDAPALRVQVHQSPNVYWSRAVNLGLSMLDRRNSHPHDYYLISNNDIDYHSESVHRMVSLLRSDMHIGAVAPTGSALGGMQDFAAVRGHWRQYVQELTELNGHISAWAPRRVSALVGASMIVPSDIWNQVGGLDERMPLGADDHDLCIRIKEIGFRLYVAQNTYVNHGGHLSGPLAPEIWSEKGAESWEVFNRKWDGYYATEEEAINCHWGFKYVKGWEKGSGWTEDRERWRNTQLWPK